MDFAEYAEDCPSLPADRPDGFPHIIKLQSDFEMTETDFLTCADGVATFLWHWNKDEFHRFFDLTEAKFELEYHAPGSAIEKMVIKRNKKRVMAGLPVAIPGQPGEFQWDPKVEFTVLKSGRWKPRSCETVWYKGPDKENTEDLGTALTKTIISYRMWDVASQPNTTVGVAH